MSLVHRSPSFIAPLPSPAPQDPSPMDWEWTYEEEVGKDINPQALKALIEFIVKKEQLPSNFIKSAKGSFSDMPPVQMAALKRAGPQVHFLDLSNITLKREVIDDIAAFFPNLKVFIAKNTGLTDAVIERLRSCAHLTKVDIEQNPNLSDNALSSLSKLSRLRELAVGGSYSDRGIDHLSQLPSLTSLKLKECSQITNAAVVRIGSSHEGFKQLHTIQFVGCNGITDDGAVDLVTSATIRNITIADCKNVSREIQANIERVNGITFSDQELP